MENQNPKTRNVIMKENFYRFSISVFIVMLMFFPSKTFAKSSSPSKISVNNALLTAVANGDNEVVIKILEDSKAAAAELVAESSKAKPDSKKIADLKAKIVDIDCRNKDGRTPLMLAAYNGRITAVRMLIENKADIDAVDHNGASSLFLAVKGRKNDVCDYLLEKKANVKKKDNSGQNMLIYAINYDNIEIIGRLLDTGAEVNIQDNDGYTPLIIAVMKKQYATVELLVKKGADLDKKNKKNKTAMDYAENNKKLQTLLKRG